MYGSSGNFMIDGDDGLSPMSPNYTGTTYEEEIYCSECGCQIFSGNDSPANDLCYDCYEEQDNLNKEDDE